MAHKKIVFIIVEGPSDYISLSNCLDKLFDKNTVYVEVTHGDITTDEKTNTGNIIKKIYSFVKEYADNNSYSKTNFKQIIHIIDTDGVFIKESFIQEKPEIQKVEYYPSSIICKNRNNIILRNQQKSAILNKLIGTESIWGIQYNTYFMSCNLDHVLYDLPNSSDEQKESNSIAFARKYKNNIDGFKSYFLNSPFSVISGYQESWNYIKEGNHSLERHTNLGLCFPYSE